MNESSPSIHPAVVSALWGRGELSWKLRPEQRLMKQRIEAAGTQLFVGNISRRWGKSFTLVLYSIEQCLKHPGMKIRYGAAFQTDLAEFILPAFYLILDDCPDHLRPTYSETRKKWLFKNGSEIGLVGLDKKPNGLRGNAISKIIIDEAAFVSNLEYIYTSVIIPATAKQKDIKCVFLSTPPESPEHYFVSLIERAKGEGSYATFTIDDISDLSPDEKERLIRETGGPTSITTRREWYCQILVDTERAVAPTFNKHLHVQEFEEPKWANWLAVTDTGGVNDLTAMLLVTYDYPNQKILVCDELIAQPNTPTDTWLEGVKAVENGRTCTRVVDASGQLLIDLSAKGYAASLPRKDEFHAGLMLLRNAFYNNEVLIHPKCLHLIGALESCLLTPNRTDFLRSKVYGHADSIAALIYALRHVDKTNPVPLHAMGITAQSHYIPPDMRHSNQERTLKEAFSSRRYKS